MCGGGGVTTTKNKSSGLTEEYAKQSIEAQKAAQAAASAYAKKWGVDQPDETGAYGGIRENSLLAEMFMPAQQQLIQNLYGGGGMGEGADYIRDSYSQAAPVYGQYLDQGYLDPMSNPYLQPAIEAARSGAYNDVANRFNKAGRSFSGAEGAAYGTAATNAALPMLLGQYNTNVGAQQNAAQGLLSGALGASGGLDAAQLGVLKAQMSAPGQIAGLNIPENMLLGITDRQRKAAQDAAALQISAMSGMPSLGGTTTSSTSSDPFQTMLGGGLGLLGMFM